MEIDITAKTIEEAVDKARAEYDLGDRVFAYEVVEYPKPGFLGIGGKPAVIRINYKTPEEIAAEEAAEAARKAEREERRRERGDRGDRRDRRDRNDRRERSERAERPAPRPEPEQPAEEPEVVMVELTDEERDMIGTFVRDILDKAGYTGYTLTIDNTHGKIDVLLEGDDLGGLLTKQGAGVDGLQVLVSLLLNRENEENFRKVSVDINGYKQKVVSRLENLAVRISRQVLKTRRKVTLNPMTAYQRRIIHSKVQEFRNLQTYSVGTEPNRRVVISYVYPDGQPKRPRRQPRPESSEDNE